MKAHLIAGTEFMTWNDVPRINMKAWRSEYRRCAPIWHKRLRAALRRHEISAAIIPLLADAMLLQSQRVIACGQLLDDLKPPAVITEHDRNTLSSCLVLAARTRGIPTITMMHGVLNHGCAYTPLLADVALCWGEQHREQMIELGTKSERLVVTGCQRLSRKLYAEPEVARAKVGLPPNKPLALLATNPILPEHRKKLAWAFCEALARNKECCAAVRLHPSEKLDEYTHEAAAFPAVRFLLNDCWTLDEALAAADIVVCHDSGLGNDALVKGKLTVVLDVLPVPLGNGKDLVENAGCPRARSARELSEVVTDIMANPILRQRLRARAEHYVHKFCAAFGDDAARNVADEVLRQLSARSANTVKSRRI